MAKVLLRNLKKSYGETAVLHGVNMEIGEGEFVVIVGPSGCGKSTLLRMVAGLEGITEGEIVIGGQVVNRLEPAQRNIAMVFQNYALYPHLTVRQNMSYGLKIARMPTQLIDKKVDEVAVILGLTELLERKPRQLSGGQRQRVAMGRAIVREPAVFLFDEPLSNLDAKLRIQMRIELELLHQRLKTTSLYVTHDQIEAMTLADRMMVLNAGVVEQIGTPEEVYTHPASRFVAGFIGSPPMNFLSVQISTTGEMLAESGNGGECSTPLYFDAHSADLPERFTLGMRPEHLQLCPAETAMAQAQVRVVENLGADSNAYCRLGDQEIIIRLPGNSKVKKGDILPFRPAPESMHYFDHQTGKRLV